MGEVGNNQYDIESLLREWEYDPENERNNIRVIQGADGIRKLQVRTYEDGIHGISQMYADGRPDGKRPYNYDFAYEFYSTLVLNSLDDNGSSATDFVISSNASSELLKESRLIFRRYELFNWLGFYKDVIEDTERDITALDLVIGYANNLEDRNYAIKQILYPITLNAIKSSELEVINNDNFPAEPIIDALCIISNLNAVGCTEFYIDKLQSVTSLAAYGITIGEKKKDYNAAMRIAREALDIANNLPTIVDERFNKEFDNEITALESIIKSLEKSIRREMNSYSAGYVFEDTSKPYVLPCVRNKTEDKDYEDDIIEGVIVDVSDEERAALTGVSAINRQKTPAKEQLSERQALERELEMAIVLENYEEAAIIRDKLKGMKK